MREYDEDEERKIVGIYALPRYAQRYFNFYFMVLMICTNAFLVYYGYYSLNILNNLDIMLRSGAASGFVAYFLTISTRWVIADIGAAIRYARLMQRKLDPRYPYDK